MSSTVTPDVATPTTRVGALEEARTLVAPALRTALHRLDPSTREACSYHLGFTGVDGGPGSGGGKGVRSALALLSARAAGAGPEHGVPAAVACELLHNFSLLHDDVMDGDAERRHRPTVWARFGVPRAILAGDALQALAGEVLAETATPTVPWAVRLLHATTRRLVAGQASDLAFESADAVTLEQCLAMVRDKTGALLACSASMGAVLADAPARLAVGLADYGTHLGLAFQLTDDLLGIWGAPERTGKPVASDLRSRKRSVPVVVALESGTEAGARLERLYAHDGALTESDVEQATHLVEEAGGRSRTHTEADAESAAARAALSGLGLPREVHDDLVALTELLSTRES